MIALKDGVRIVGLRTEMVAALDVADGVFSQYVPDSESGRHTVVTSGVEGQHSWGSLHYQGAALDFRTRHLSEDEQVAVADEIGRQLGEDFDVVLESTHLHIEFQPKGPV